MRVALTAAALLWAGLLMQDNVAARQPFATMFDVAPRFAWVGVFGLNAAALGWRIVATKPRITITRIVNASTCALWMTCVCAEVITRGTVCPDVSSDLVMLLSSVWVALRTSLTVDDRESA